MWVVKWIQGAVAAGADQANVLFRRKAAEVAVYGHFPVNAEEIADNLLADALPATAAERYWVSALDELPSGRLTIASRHGAYRQTAVIQDGRSEVSVVEYRQACPTLSLRFEPAALAPPWQSPWQAEALALRKRLKYCSMPVVIGRKVICPKPVFSDGKALMNWMELAMGNELSFQVQGDPKQILAPSLVAYDGSEPGLHRCALMMTLSRTSKGAGRARAFWVRHGALIGPIALVGPTGVMNLDILCPGDGPGKDLSDWALRDPSAFFPEQLILSVSRRLAGGLDSLLGSLAYRQTPAHDLVRQAGRFAPLPALLTRGRPELVLTGAVRDSLQAFSLRKSLELSTS